MQGGSVPAIFLARDHTISNKLIILGGVALIVIAIAQLVIIAISVSQHPPASSYQWGYLSGRLTVAALISWAGYRLIRHNRHKG